MKINISVVFRSHGLVKGIQLKQLAIDVGLKCHMFSYFSNGTIQIKENLCKCYCCKFINCKIEKEEFYGVGWTK